MDINQTEEQQVEQLKKIWQDYGNSIITGLVLGFAGFIGYGYYQDSKYQAELLVSEDYQQVLTLIEAGDEKFQSDAKEFITNNAGTSYAALTAFSLAKDSADKKDWPQVEKHLTAVIENTKEQGMVALATIRLARVQIEQAQYEQALATLNKPLPESFKSTIEEIKGDAFLLQGDKSKARIAYQTAIDAIEGKSNPALQLKLDDLAEHIILSK